MPFSRRSLSRLIWVHASEVPRSIYHSPAIPAPACTPRALRHARAETRPFPLPHKQGRGSVQRQRPFPFISHSRTRSARVRAETRPFPFPHPARGAPSSPCADQFKPSKGAKPGQRPGAVGNEKRPRSRSAPKASFCLLQERIHPIAPLRRVARPQPIERNRSALPWIHAIGTPKQQQQVPIPALGARRQLRRRCGNAPSFVRGPVRRPRIMPPFEPFRSVQAATIASPIAQ